MANIFKEEKKRSVPKTFKECVDKGPVEKEIWDWADRVQMIGEIILCIIIAGGLFISVLVGMEEEETTGFFSESTEATFNAGKAFVSFAIFTVCGLVEYCAYHVIALLLGAQASVVENTRISANIAMYKAAQEEVLAGTNVIQSQNQETSQWKCSSCGTINDSKYCVKCGAARN